MRFKDQFGLLIAVCVIVAWSVCLYFGLTMEVDYSSPGLYLMMLLQGHLYTGLFITAHDAMHGTVSMNKKINTLIGHVSSALFSFNFYHRLFPKHHEHHRYVATDRDPDYHEGGMIAWYFSFLKQYINIWQFLLMAVTYNILKQFIPVENLILLWMAPAFLAIFTFIPLIFIFFFTCLKTNSEL